jgi:hypothetical protein
MCTIRLGEAAAVLITAPSGARLPRTIRSPPLAWRGSDSGRIMSRFRIVTPCRFSPNALPLAVITAVSSSGSSSFITATMPPA